MLPVISLSNAQCFIWIEVSLSRGSRPACLGSALISSGASWQQAQAEKTSVCVGLRDVSLICAGAVFFSLVFLALTSLTTVDLLVNERGLVVKESLGGYYRPVSYYLSKGEPQPAVPQPVVRGKLRGISCMSCLACAQNARASERLSRLVASDQEEKWPGREPIVEHMIQPEALP